MSLSQVKTLCKEMTVSDRTGDYVTDFVLLCNRIINLFHLHCSIFLCIFAFWWLWSAHKSLTALHTLCTPTKLTLFAAPFLSKLPPLIRLHQACLEFPRDITNSLRLFGVHCFNQDLSPLESLRQILFAVWAYPQSGLAGCDKISLIRTLARLALVGIKICVFQIKPRPIFL